VLDYKTYYGSIVSAAQNGPPIAEYFNTYLNMNPMTGYLAFEVHQNSPVKGRVPVPNARVTISKLLGDDYYFSKVITTDENGETDPIPLPTVSRERSLKPGEGQAFASYRASVEAPGYIRQDIYDLQIFDGITSVQHVDLQPVEAGRSAQPGRAGIPME
jgi:hypothetical protein